MKVSINNQKMYPPPRGPLRAHQARPDTLHHPLLLPPHSHLHIQKHPLLQQLDRWLGVHAVLACLTLPREWNHLLLSHL